MLNILSERPLPTMTATRRKVAQLLISPYAANAGLQQRIQRDPGFSLAQFRHFGSRTQESFVNGFATRVSQGE